MKTTNPQQQEEVCECEHSKWEHTFKNELGRCHYNLCPCNVFKPTTQNKSQERPVSTKGNKNEDSAPDTLRGKTQEK